MNDMDQLFTVAEAAAFLGISKPTIYRWVEARKIPHIKNDHYLRFSANALSDWLQRNTVEPQ